jgi:hypothetical protein
MLNINHWFEWTAEDFNKHFFRNGNADKRLFQRVLISAASLRGIPRLLRRKPGLSKI